MKKIILALSVALLTLSANAQLLKSGLLNGYNAGDNLEKSVYQAKNDEPVMDSWAGAFASRPSEVASPVIVEGMTYEGYPEMGPAIKLGTPAGVKGTRFSVYPIDNKRAYSKGTLYLACLVDMSKAGKGAVEVLGLSASPVAASNRAAIKVLSEGANGIRFATNVLKSQAETTMAYDYDKPHLVILKLDYNNQTASLFIDPKPDAEPAEADCVATGDADNVLKHAIKSISLRNRSGNEGRVGNIRFARTWADLFSAN